MIALRHLTVVAAVVVAASLVAGSGGVSSIGAERNVRIAVADDPSAYLGFEQTSSGTANGTTNLTLTVTNQFPPGTSLTTVDATVDGQTADLTVDGPLDSGESASSTFETVACDAKITVVASGDGVSTQLNRTVVC